MQQVLLRKDFIDRCKMPVLASDLDHRGLADLVIQHYALVTFEDTNEVYWYRGGGLPRRSRSKGRDVPRVVAV